MRKLNIDFKALANSTLAKDLSRHLGDYETRVKEMVHELDLKSRDAREKSKLRLDEFTTQLKKTRSELETKVSALVQKEGQRLNTRVADLLKYLKSVAGSEKIAETPVATASRKKASTKSDSDSEKTTARKKKSARKPGTSARSKGSEASATTHHA